MDKPQFIKKKCLASFDADESDAKSTASSMKSAFSTSSVKSAASRVWQRLAGSGGVGDDSKSTASKKTVPSKLVASIKNVFTKKQTDNLDWFDALLVDVKYSTAEDDCNVFNSPNEYLNAAKDLVTQGESLEYLMPYLKCANNMFQDQPTTNPFDRVAAMIVLAGLTNGDNEHALTEDFFKKATALVYQQVKGFRVDFDENGVAIYKDSQIDTLIKASTYATQLKQSLGIFLAHNEVLSVIIGTGFYDYVVADAALAGTTKSSAPVKVIHELKLVATAFGKTFGEFLVDGSGENLPL